MLKETLKIWPQSVIYFLALILPAGLLTIQSVEPPPAILIAVCCAVAYIATAAYLSAVSKKAFSETSGRTCREICICLPKLIAALAVFAVIAAIVAGLLALLVYAIQAGASEEGRLPEVTAALYATVILSLPFFARAFTGFAAGEMRAGILIEQSAHMGLRLYVKLLIPCGAAYIAILLIRQALPDTGLAFAIAAPITAAALLGIAAPIALHIYARHKSMHEDDEPVLPLSAKGKGA